jgi:hypothetical protein
VVPRTFERVDGRRPPLGDRLGVRWRPELPVPCPVDDGDECARRGDSRPGPHRRSGVLAPPPVSVGLLARRFERPARPLERVQCWRLLDVALEGRTSPFVEVVVDVDVSSFPPSVEGVRRGDDGVPTGGVVPVAQRREHRLGVPERRRCVLADDERLRRRIVGKRWPRSQFRLDVAERREPVAGKGKADGVADADLPLAGTRLVRVAQLSTERDVDAVVAAAHFGQVYPVALVDRLLVAEKRVSLEVGVADGGFEPRRGVSERQPFRRRSMGGSPRVAVGRGEERVGRFASHVDGGEQADGLGAIHGGRTVDGRVADVGTAGEPGGEAIGYVEDSSAGGRHVVGISPALVEGLRSGCRGTLNTQ